MPLPAEERGGSAIVIDVTQVHSGRNTTLNWELGVSGESTGRK